MDNLNNIPNVGNWGDAASRLNDNFNKIKQAVTTVENTSKNNKGYFASLSALNTAFPSPKDGQIAYVYDEASSTQYYIYNAVDGAWVATSIEAPSVGVDLEGYTKTGGSTKTTKEVEDDLAQLAKILILQRGQILSNSIRQYVPFPVKQNDVVHLVTSNVDLIITDPLTQYYSVSLAKDESTTNLQPIVNGEVVEKDVYIVANSDYEYVYLHVNPNTGVVSYDVKIEIIPFEKLKDWILSEAYTVSDMTYDTYGNVKTAQLTYPDGTEGVIQTSTSDAEGRLLTMIFTYGKPAIIYLQMTITYLGDLVDTITINKV
jgi:hypothetical protein